MPPGQTPPPGLDVVVVNWNTRALCEELLPQLEPLTRTTTRHRGQATVVVVDNGSTDGSADALEARFPWVRLVRSDRNLGFAGGVNLALAETSGRYTLLVNPDVHLRPGVVDRLLDSLVADPSCAVLGPALVVPGEGYQIGAAGRDLDLSSALSHFSLLSRVAPPLFPGLFLHQAYWADRGRPVAVGWVCGAAMLLRRAVLEAVGGMPTASFLYAEDLHVCRLVREAGHQVVYDPRIQVVHDQGGSQRDQPGSTRWVEATLDDYGRRATPLRRTAMKAIFGGGFLARFAAYSAAGVVSGSSRLTARAERMRAYASAALSHRWGTP
jgi:N-acetylglucosaminyl-diphospho-decaprenol L-rhamnosyltransferase